MSRVKGKEMEVKIDKPKEFYQEVEKLIYAHYRSSPRKGFNVTEDSFAPHFPVIYHLFLEIAALGLNK